VTSLSTQLPRSVTSAGVDRNRSRVFRPDERREFTNAYGWLVSMGKKRWKNFGNYHWDSSWWDCDLWLVDLIPRTEPCQTSKVAVVTFYTLSETFKASLDLFEVAQLHQIRVGPHLWARNGSFHSHGGTPSSLTFPSINGWELGVHPWLRKLQINGATDIFRHASVGMDRNLLYHINPD